MSKLNFARVTRRGWVIETRLNLGNKLNELAVFDAVSKLYYLFDR
mgnify:CR=1 FL=1